MKNKQDRGSRQAGQDAVTQQQAEAAAAAVDAVFQRARTHHAAGRLADAEPLYREVLQAYPDHPDALHLLGVLGYQVGYAEPALELIDRAIQVKPDFAEANFSRGNALYALQRFEAALESYDRAIELNPLYAEAHSNRGGALHALGQHQAAVESYDRAVQLRPDYVDAYANRATSLCSMQRYREAVASYDEVVFLRPDFVEAYYNRGNALYAMREYQAAAESFGKAVQLRPAYVEALVSRGNALQAMQQYPAAVEDYDKAIELNPQQAEAYNNRGSALHALGQYQAALASYDKAIELKPGTADAYSNRGSTLHALEQVEASLESCDKAIELNPQMSEAHYNRGNALYALKRCDAALASYENAILLNPGHPESHNNRGNCLYVLERYETALGSYGEAIRLKPEYADAHANMGNTLQALKRHEEAVESYDETLRLQPENAEVYYNRGNILQVLTRYDEALASYDKAAFYRPGYAYLEGMRLHMRRFRCDWEGIEDACKELEASIERGEKASVPFPILAMSGSPTVQMRAAEIYAQDRYPASTPAVEIPRRPRRDKIRIGYFSADYHNHATSYLMAELFERHDRSKFEILGFSFGAVMGDEMGRRVSGAMDRFLDVRLMPDAEVALLSRELDVDIAVDLKGFTRDNRTAIFADQAAPIQVSYLGYPGTMGIDYIDYLIADPTLIPEASRKYYREKIVYLPDSYQVNDTQRHISEKPCVRADEGLPDGAFVYCCFNNAYKISPAMFDVWMRVLGRVDGSVLWLMEENRWVAANLRKEAERRGIAGERLVFAKPAPLAEHLARQRLADLFLDTLPYNAHTTASDALWAGLPVVTRIGETFAGRVAASLLRAVDLAELITTSVAEYEELAVELARDGERRRAIGRRLTENRLRVPLFDIAAFTSHLEAAYSAMYERYQAGLAPEHIEVARIKQ